MQSQRLKKAISYLLLFVLLGNPLLVAAEGISLAVGADQTNTGLRNTMNGVTVVDIATPSAKGVSHNKFADFNVPAQGVIFNNSLTPGVSAIGGWVDGNRRLAGGTASLILAEVTGRNRSELLGFTEIFGDSAEFVLANANGITCNGCGFINTPRVTLTTGLPQFSDGGLTGFDVRGGDVAFDGQGMNASNVSQFDIIAGAMSLNAVLYADKLNIISGNNQVDYQTGAAALNGQPSDYQFALDASALGAMYANQIRLIGNGDGLGVRSEGMISATNQLELTADGELKLKDVITSGALTLQSRQAGLTTTGNVFGQVVDIWAQGQIVNQGLLAAAESLKLQGQGLLQSGDLIAGLGQDGSLLTSGELQIQLSAGLQNSGKILSQSQATIVADSLNNTESGLIQSRQLSGLGGDWLNMGTVLAEQLAIESDSFGNSGTVQAGRMDWIVQQLNQSAGWLLQTDADAAFNFSGQTLSISGGQVYSAGQTRINATLVSNGGSWQLTGQAAINTDVLQNSGTLYVQSDASFNIKDLNNSGDMLFAAEQGPVWTGLTQLNNSGRLQINARDYSFNLTGALINSGELLHLGEGVFSVSAAQLNNSGSVLSNQQLDLKSDDFINSGTVSAKLLQMQAATLTNSGEIIAEQLTLSAQRLLNDGGTLVSLSDQAGSMQLSVSDEIRNRKGTIASNSSEFSLATKLFDNSEGTVRGQTLLSIDAAKLVNNQGSIVASSVTARTNQLENDAGTIAATDRVGIYAAEFLNGTGVVQGQRVDLNADRISTSGVLFGDRLTLTTDELTMTGGQIRASNLLTLTATQASISGDSLVQAQNVELDTSSLMLGRGASLEATALSLKATDISNRGDIKVAGEEFNLQVRDLTNFGTIQSQALRSTIQADSFSNYGQLLQFGGGPMDLNVAGELLNAGTIQVDGDLRMNAWALHNQSGSIAAKGRVQIQANELKNQPDALISGQSLTIHAGTIENQGAMATQRLELKANSLSNSGLMSALAASLSATSFQNSGQLLLTGSTQDSQITSSNILNSGLIYTQNNNFVLNTDWLNNSGGQFIQSGGGSAQLDIGEISSNFGGTIALNAPLSLQMDRLNNENGVIQASELSVAVGELNNKNGKLIATSDLAELLVDVKGDWNNESGQLLSAAKTTTLNALNLLNAGGTIQMQGVGVLDVATLNNLNAGVIQAGGALTLATGSLQNSGAIQGDTVRLSATTLENSGLIAATGSAGSGLSIEAEQLLNQGRIVSEGTELNLAARLINSSGTMLHYGPGIFSVEALEVRNSGQMASAGALQLTSSELQNSGQLLAAGQLQIDTELFNSSGKVQARDVLVHSNSLTNSGDLLASRNMLLGAAGITNAGRIEAERLELQSSWLENSGSVESFGKQQQSFIHQLTHINNSGVLASQGQDFSLQLQQLTNSGKILHYGTGLLAIEVLDKLDNLTGQILAKGDVNLISQALDNGSGLIEVAGKLNIDATMLNNTDGQIRVLGDELLQLKIQQQLDNSGGQILAHSLQLEADSLLNRQGHVGSLGSQAQLELKLSQWLDNTAGLISSNGGQVSLITPVLNNSNGTLNFAGTGAASLELGSLQNSGQGQILSSQDLTVSAKTIDNQGQIAASQALTMVSEELTNQGQLLAGQLELQQQQLHNSGVISAQTAEILADQFGNTGQVDVMKALKVLVQQLQNQGRIGANQQFSLNSDNLNNQGGLLYQAGSGPFTLDVLQTLNNTQGQILAGQGQTTIRALELLNRQGEIQAAGVFDLQADLLDNQDGELSAGQARLDLKQLTNGGTGLIAADQLQLLSQSVQNAAAISARQLVLRTDLMQNSAGAQLSGAELDLDIGELNNAGQISAGQQLQLVAGKLTNQQQALLGSAGTLQINAAELQQQGQIVATGQAEINADLLNNTGLIAASQLAITSTQAANAGVWSADALTVQLGSLDNSGEIGAQSIQGQLNSLNNSGSLIASGTAAHSWSLQPGKLFNTGLIASFGADWNLNSSELHNQKGQLLHLGQGQFNLNLTSSLVNEQGVLASEGNLAIKAALLQNSGGQILADQLETEQQQLVNHGLIQAEQIKVRADSVLNGAQGQLAANDKLLLDSAQIENKGSLSARVLELKAQTVKQQGQLVADQLTVNAGQLHNSGQTVAGSAQLKLTELLNSGSLISKAQQGSGLSIITDSLTNSGLIANAGNNLQLQSRLLNNDTGQIQHVGAGVLALDVLEQLSNRDGELVSASDLTLSTAALDNSGGLIQIEKSGQLQATELINQQGTIVAFGAAPLVLDSVRMDNTGGTLGAEKLIIRSAVLDNQQGEILAGQLQMELDQLSNTKGAIRASSAHIQANNLSNTQGELSVMQQLQLSLSGHLDNQQGLILTGQQTSISADSLNNSGVIALQGNAELQLSLQGTAQNSGTISSAGLLGLNSARLQNDGLLDAKTLQLQSAELKTTGQIQGETVTIKAGQFSNAGSILATASQGKSLQIQSEQPLLNSGHIQSHGDRLELSQLVNQGGKVVLAGIGVLALDSLINRNGVVYSAADIQLTGNSSNLQSGLILAERDLQASVSVLDNSAGEMQAGGLLQLKATELINDGGQITGAGSASRIEADRLSNRQGALVSKSTLQAQLTSLDNTGGLIAAQSNLTLDLNTLDNSAGTISSGGQLQIKADELLNRQGLVSAAGAELNIIKLNNALGRIETTGNLLIDSQSLNNDGGQLIAKGAEFSLKVTGTLSNNAGGRIETAAQQALLQAGVLNNNSGVLYHSGSGVMTLTTDSSMDNSKGTVASLGSLLLTTGNSLNGIGLNNTQGQIFAKGPLKLELLDALQNQQGQISSEQQLSLNAAAFHNQSGELVAAQGLQLTTTADITNTDGLILNKAGQMHLQAASLNNLGQGSVLQQNGTTTLALKSLTNQGQMALGSQALVQAETLTNSGLLTATELQLQTDQLANSGQLSAALLQIDSKILNNDNGVLASTSGFGESLKLNTPGQISNRGGLIQSAGQQLQLLQGVDNRAGEIRLLGTGVLSIDALQNQQGTVVSAGALTLTGDTDNSAGVLQAAGQLNLTAEQFNNAQGLVYGQQGLVIQADSLNNRQGTIAAAGQANIQANELQNQNGVIQAAGSGLQLTANSLNNDGGSIYQQGSGPLTVQVLGALSNKGGTIAAQQQFDLTAASLDNSAGVLSAAQLQIQTAGLNNSAGRIQANELSLNATTLDNSNGGTLLGLGSSDRALQLNISGLLNNSGGVIESRGNNFALTSVQELNNQGGKIRHLGSGELVLQPSAELNNSSGQIATLGRLSLDFAQILNSNGTISAKGPLSLTTTKLVNDSGLIESGQQLVLNSTNTVSNTAGAVVAAGQLTVQTAGSLDNKNGTFYGGQGALLSASTIDNSGGSIGSGAGLTIQSGSVFNNQSGTVVAAGNLELDANQVLNNAGAMQAGALLIETSELNNSKGSLQGNTVKLISGSLNNSQGTILANSTTQNALDLSQAGPVNNSSGTLATRSTDWTVSTSAINNDNGRLLHLGTGTFSLLSAGSLSNNGVIASSGDLLLQSSGVTNSGTLQAARQLTAQGAFTNTGSGVINAGVLDLQAGNQTVSNAGQITAQQQLTVQAGNLNNSGILYSQGQMQLNAGQISNSGVLSANVLTAANFGLFDNSGRVETSSAQLTGGSLQNRAGALLFNSSTAANSLQLNVSALSNSGTIYNNSATMTVTGNLSNQGTLFHAGSGSLTLAHNGSANISGGQIASAGILNLQSNLSGAGRVTAVQGMNINTGGTFVNTGAQLYTQGNLTLNSALDNRSGSLIADGQLVINTSGLVNNESGIIQGLALSLTAASLNNQNGVITSTGSGNGQILVGSLNNSAGLIQTSNSNFTLNVSSLNNTGGDIRHSGGGTLAINSSGAIQQQGRILSAGVLSIETLAELNNNNGQLAGSSFNLKATGQFSNNGGTVQASSTSGSSQLTAAAITNNSGVIWANGSGLTLTTGGALQNNAGQILQAGTGTLQVNAASLSNASAGKLISNGAMGLEINGSVQNAGQISSAGNLTLRAQDLTNQDLISSRNGQLNATLTGLTNSGVISGKNAMTLNTSTLNNSAGTLQSEGHLTVGTGGLTIGRIMAGQLTLNTSSALTIQSSDVLSSAGAMSLTTTGGLTNAGQVTANGALTVNSSSLINQLGAALKGAANSVISTGSLSNQGILSSNNNLTITASSSQNSGTIAAAGTLTHNASLTNSNLVFAGQALNINGSVSNTANLYSNGSMTISGSSIQNNGGVISSVGQMMLSGTIENNRVGGVINYSPSTTTTSYEEGERYGYETFNANRDYSWKLDSKEIKTTEQKATVTGNEGLIVSGGNMTLNGSVTNNFSTISSGGVMQLTGASVVNNSVQNKLVREITTYTENWTYSCLQGTLDNCTEPGLDFMTGREQTGQYTEENFQSGAYGIIVATGGIQGKVDNLIQTDISALSPGSQSANTAVSGSAGSVSRGNDAGATSSASVAVTSQSGQQLGFGGQSKTNVNTGSAQTGLNSSNQGVSAGYSNQTTQTAAQNLNGPDAISPEATAGNALEQVKIVTAAQGPALSAVDLSNQQPDIKPRTVDDRRDRQQLGPIAAVQDGDLDKHGLGRQPVVGMPVQNPDLIPLVVDGSGATRTEVTAAVTAPEQHQGPTGPEQSEVTGGKLAGVVNVGGPVFNAVGIEAELVTVPGRDQVGIIDPVGPISAQVGPGNLEAVPDWTKAATAIGLIGNGSGGSGDQGDIEIPGQPVAELQQAQGSTGGLTAEAQGFDQSGINASLRFFTSAPGLNLPTVDQKSVLVGQALSQYNPDKVIAGMVQQQQGTVQQQRNASQSQGQQSSVFLTEQQMQVLTQELGFDEQVINQGQQVLYASLSQRDLMPDGVTIYSGGSIDLEVTNDIQLHAGIGAADELWLSTQGNLDLGNNGFFDSEHLLGLSVGGDFSTNRDLSSANLLLDIGGNFSNNASLTGTELLSISSGKSLLNQGTLSGGTVWLDAGTDLINQGRIQGSNVGLQAGGDIINRTEFSQHTIKNGENSQTYTMVGTAPQIISTDSLSMNAGNNLDLQGSKLSAAGDISLSAGKDVLLGAVEKVFGSEKYFKGGYDISYDRTYDVVSLQAGGNLSVAAGNNLQSEGAVFTALGDIELAAGNEMNLLGVVEYHEDRDKTTKKSTFKKKVTVNEEYEAIHQGTVVLAGGNISLNAQQTADGIQLFNSGNVLLEGTQMQAGGSILAYSQGEMNVVSGEEWQSETHYTKKSYAGGLFGSSKTTEIDVQYLGHSELNAAGNITLLAQNDINVLAGRINATNIIAQAGFGNEAAKAADVNILGDTETSSFYQESRRNGLALDFSDNFLSVAKETAQQNRTVQTNYIGSVFDATDNIGLTASRDINIVGSELYAGKNILLDAGRDVNVVAGAGSFNNASMESETKTGIAVSADQNSVSVFAGDDTQKLTTDSSGTLLTGSVLSAGENLQLKAGNDIQVAGSELAALQDIRLSAVNNISIVTATEKLNEQQTQSSIRDGLTVTASHNLGQLADTLSSLGQGGNAVTQASSVLKAADALNNAGPSASAHLGQTTSSTTDAVEQQLAQTSGLTAGRDIVLNAGNTLLLEGAQLGAKRDVLMNAANIQITSALDKVNSSNSSEYLQTGANLNVSMSNASLTLGFSKSDSELDTQNSSAVGSVINAGRDVTLNASNDLTIAGSDISAVNDVALVAGNNIDIKASQGSFGSQSNDSHQSVGAGINFGSDGIGFTANMAMGEGDLDREGTTNTNSHITAGKNLTVTSGNNTSIVGGNLSGTDISMDVGGDLTLASVQDKGKVEGERWDVAANLTVGAGVSGGASVGKGETQGSSAWVNEQSSIIGASSVTIRTEGHTQIDGAVIANQDAEGNDLGNLTLDTGTLGFSDIKDHDKEDSYYLNVGFNAGDNTGTNQTESGTTYTASGSLSSHDKEQINRATVGDGTITVRDTPEQDLSGLNRDTALAQQVTKDESSSTELYVSSTSVKSVGNLISNPGTQLEQWTANVESIGDTKAWGIVAENGTDALEDTYNAASKAVSEKDLKAGNFWEALDSTHKITQLKNDLTRTPEGLALLEKLKSDDPDERLAAQAELGQLAQDKFGIDPSEIRFYDGSETTSDSLRDTVLADVKGGTVLEEGNSEFGNIFINVDKATDGKDMTNTLGHEVYETVTLQTQGTNDAAQEVIAGMVGEQLANRIDQAMGGALATVSTGGLGSTGTVQQGTQHANAVGNARVDYYLTKKTVDEVKSCLTGQTCSSAEQKAAVLGRAEALSKVLDNELNQVCKNSPESDACRTAVNSATQYIAMVDAWKVLNDDTSRSSQNTFDYVYNSDGADGRFALYYNTIDNRADLFGASNQYEQHVGLGAQWFGGAEFVSRAPLTGLGADGDASWATFGVGGLMTGTDVYEWRNEAGNTLINAGFDNFKNLYNQAVTDPVAWDINQLRNEQAALQPVHEGYLGDRVVFRGIGNAFTDTLIPILGAGNNPLTDKKQGMPGGIDILDYKSRVKFGCKLLGYSEAQGCKP